MALYIESDYEFNPLLNPKFVYVNPKFTLNAFGYYPMMLVEYINEKNENGIYVGIVYLNNQGVGSVLNQEYELICTIETDVENHSFELEWDTDMSIVNAVPNRFVRSGWVGELHGWEKGLDN